MNRVSVCIASSALLFLLLSLDCAATERTKIAEGEYVGGSGEPTKPKSSLATLERWTLWKDADGSLEVEGQMLMATSTESWPTMNLAMLLSGDLGLASFSISSPEKKGSIECKLAPNLLRCDTVDPAGKKEHGEQAFTTTYTLMGPSLSWTFAGVCRLAQHNKVGEATPVTIVSWDDTPTEFLWFEAKVSYLGQEDITAAGKQITAKKFKVSSDGLNVQVWTSREGLVLAFEDAKRPEQRWELKNYRDYAGFAPELGSAQRETGEGRGRKVGEAEGLARP